MGVGRLALFCSLLLSSPLWGQTVEGKFGRGLAVEKYSAYAGVNPVYTVVPLTVECFARITAKSTSAEIVLLSNEPRSSGTHWDLFAEKSTGNFGVVLPSFKTERIISKQNIADDRWHYLTMLYDGQSVRLYVDAKEVTNQKLEKIFRYPDSGPLTIGHAEGFPAQTGVLIDEIRISRIIRPIEKIPDAPFTTDNDTIGLWHLNEGGPAEAFGDVSKSANPIVLGEAEKKSAMSENNNRWQQMDHGRFFSATFDQGFPAKNTVPKGIAVQLGTDKKAHLLFDTELLRPAVAWTGNFIKIVDGREGLAGPPSIGGAPVWGTAMVPGWSTTENFADPRPNKLGPLPRDIARYNGLYVNGERVIFSYAIGQTRILESQSFVGDCFVRTVWMDKSDQPLWMLVCDKKGSGDALGVGVIGGEGLSLQMGQRTSVRIPPHATPMSFKVTMASAAASDTGRTEDLAELIHGGPARFPEPVTTKGVLGKNDQPYTVDTLTPPEENPWKSFLRFGGHDFFKNGDIAICSVSGDVWVVSGVDEKLENLKWRRYATGLFQPLGLRIIEDKVYVLGRDQITRLHDLNGDGEADYYENFNNDGFVTTNGHSYVTNLETDPQGNFYYTKCGDGTPHGGSMLKVSKDGSKLEVFATGLRNPNGAGVSPTGMVTEADNQGEWVPASRLDVVKPGAFLGYQPMSHWKTPPTDPGKPLCWMPQNVDNSSGGQCWVLDDRWGPFKDSMIHTSYGAARVLLVLQEEVNGQVQGGVVTLPLSFASGIMRGRFSPADGQLYVSGLRGWQTTGSRSGALQRVRYTGKPVHMPSSLNVHANGLKIGFTCPLDAKSATNPDNWSVLQWNYRWTANYGSRHWTVSNPNKQGYDTLEVKKATLLPDGKSVFLEIDDLRPVMQMQIAYRFTAADGGQIKGDIHNTIHNLGPAFVGEKTAWDQIAPYFSPPAEYAYDFGKFRSPLLFDDGHPVKTKEDWAQRHKQIIKFWTDTLGPWPAVIDDPKMEVLERFERDGIRYHRVRVEIVPDQMVEGYLLVPIEGGPFPGVVVPFYEPQTSIGTNPKNRTTDFAYQLSKRGFVTLSIGSPGGDSRDPKTGEAKCQPLMFLGYVAANCYQALAALPYVDAKRIGIVGHSYGGKWAMFGSCFYE
ncbi:MAG TPA: DUF6797 domain-containing protein, partial [Tepidisphaeraceae bacterium]|nr:DUF6797 domain-containing protein [Tepidisphaeraceae bacterium]